MEYRNRYDRQGYGRRPRPRAASRRIAAGPNTTAAIYVNAYASDGTDVEIWDDGNRAGSAWLDSGNLNINITDTNGRTHGYTVNLENGSIQRY